MKKIISILALALFTISNIYSQEREILFALELTVLNSITGDAIDSAIIKITGSDSSFWQTTSNSKGNLNKACPLKINVEYSITVEKEGYLGSKGYETTVGFKNSTQFYHEYAIQPIDANGSLNQKEKTNLKIPLDFKPLSTEE